MQSTHLTEPELAFITGIMTSYKNRRLAAMKKATRKSASAKLESTILNNLVDKLNTLCTQASEEAEAVQEINDLVEEISETKTDVDAPVVSPFV